MREYNRGYIRHSTFESNRAFALPLAKRARRTIWFTRQIWSTTMKESRRRVIFHALGWGRCHCCNSDGPCVSIRSNDCIVNIISSNTQGGQFQYLVRRPAITFPILKGAKKQTSTCFNRSGRRCSLEYWKNVPWRCTATRKLEIQVILVDSIRPKIWCFPYQMRHFWSWLQYWLQTSQSDFWVTLEKLLCYIQCCSWCMDF